MMFNSRELDHFQPSRLVKLHVCLNPVGQLCTLPNKGLTIVTTPDQLFNGIFISSVDYHFIVQLDFFIDRLQEYYVVLLSPAEMEESLKIILQIPIWAQRVIYIKGQLLINEILYNLSLMRHCLRIRFIVDLCKFLSIVTAQGGGCLTIQSLKIAAHSGKGSCVKPLPQPNLLLNKR